jgi:aspartate dehydrogenase
MNIALIGLGAIGQELVKYLATADAAVRVMGALVASPTKRREPSCRIYSSIEELLQARPDLVVECSRQNALQELGPRVLRAGIDLLAASAGALAQRATYDALQQAALTGGAQLSIPAGALAGVDALAAARHAGLSDVRYTRRAPPAAWVKSGALSGVDAESLREPHTLFEGSAREAATRYPKNANVAATVALAGLGFDRTLATLIADPSSVANVHVIEAEGDFGRLCTTVSARPISPATSSSKIVAGSLARSILSRVERITV